MKTGPGLKTSRLTALVVDRRADHVGGQQVGGELDPGEVQAEHPGERPGGQRLAEAGQVLEQDVAAGQDAGQDQFERRALADDRAFQLVEHGGAALGGLRWGQAGGVAG